MQMRVGSPRAAIMIYSMWVLVTNLKSSGRAKGTLNHRAIYPVPIIQVIF